MTDHTSRRNRGSDDPLSQAFAASLRADSLEPLETYAATREGDPDDAMRTAVSIGAFCELTGREWTVDNPNPDKAAAIRFGAEKAAARMRRDLPPEAFKPTGDAS